MDEGDIIIVEKGEVKEGAVLLEGMPDVGLVGVISTSYLIDMLKMEEVAEVRTDLILPIRVLHRGELKQPIRLYANDRFVVLTSELAIPPNLVYPLARRVISWAKEKGISEIISINGFPFMDRLKVEEPKVFGIVNMPKLKDLLQQNGIEMVEEGFIAGFYAILLDEAARAGIDGIALLAQCYPKYPDPGAAAAVIKVLARMLSFEVDVKPLLDKADEIRISVRDLMKQTEAMMAGMGKGIERQIPAMYR